MTRLTPVFLVLLRLAIGWHFLFEGVAKINDPAWSGATYMRESSGPLAGEFHELAGDPVLLYCEPAPPPGPRDAATVPPNQQLPPALAKEWDNWFDRFVAKYDLKGEDLDRVKRRYEQRKSQTGSWLKGEGKDAVKVTTRTEFGVSYPEEKTVPQRVADYKAARKEVARVEQKERESFVTGANAELPKKKAKVNQLKNELLADLNVQTLDMKKAVRDELPLEARAKTFLEKFKAEHKDISEDKLNAELADIKNRVYGEPSKRSEQLKAAKLSDPEVKKTLDSAKDDKQREEIVAKVTEESQKAARDEMMPLIAEYTEEESPLVMLSAAPVVKEPTLKASLPEPTAPTWRDWSWLKWDRRQWSDFLVRYGLTAVGVCLLIGLLTRTSCMAGAGFLLLFYLAMMPLPWLPENPKAEGHYVYINKNIIEMLALLALATTASGRWVGLDGLLHYFSPFRRRGKDPSGKKPRKKVKDLGAQTPRPDLEPAHSNGAAEEPAREGQPVGVTPEAPLP